LPVLHCYKEKSTDLLGKKQIKKGGTAEKVYNFVPLQGEENCKPFFILSGLLMMRRGYYWKIK